MPENGDETAPAGGSIVVHLDRMLSERRTTARDLAREIGITEANLSLLRTGKVKGIRFQTLAAICAYLDCQPGDLISFVPEAIR